MQVWVPKETTEHYETRSHSSRLNNRETPVGPNAAQTLLASRMVVAGLIASSAHGELGPSREPDLKPQETGQALISVDTSEL